MRDTATACPPSHTAALRAFSTFTQLAGAELLTLLPPPPPLGGRRKDEDTFLNRMKGAVEKNMTVEQLYDPAQRFGKRNWETVGLWCANNIRIV